LIRFGTLVGLRFGTLVGLRIGARVGVRVGTRVGALDKGGGAFVRRCVGHGVGGMTGASVMVGAKDGILEGVRIGTKDGILEGGMLGEDVVGASTGEKGDNVPGNEKLGDGVTGVVVAMGDTGLGVMVGIA
jgi:hypothetical protein